MSSTNEWDKLKKVIVGVADHAKIPPMTKSLRCVNYADKTDTSDIIHGLYPEQVINEANEDLETFVKFLEGESVEVVRPNRVDVEYYNYCPRDVLFVHGEKRLAAPMSLPARQNEWKNYLPGAAPISIGTRTNYEDEMYNEGCIGDKDQLAINELAPMFDAANAIRANDDILYLVSNTGNKAGAAELEKFLNVPKSAMMDPGNVKVHTLEGVYSYIHIDSTVAFLREGLLLLNPERITDKSVLPEPFCNWDAIMCPEPNDIGYYGNYCNASKWINMNLLSINPNLVVIEEHQTNLAKELEKYDIESALLPTRHQRTLGGGFHCVTCDLEREE
jgi:N-dimethylarginine dimethylaminohydrolase